MDALIPIILAIGFFILQAFLGYKKEQEKAAKRDFGKLKPQGETPRQREVVPSDKDWLEELLNPKPSVPPAREVVKDEQRPLQSVRPETQQPQAYKEPVYKSTYQAEKYVPSEVPASLLDEYKRISASDDVSEVRRVRRAKAAQIKPLQTISLEVEGSEGEKSLLNFNLEEAIIIKAILDRPYQ